MRNINLQGCKNIRDLGDLELGKGKVKNNMIIRSSALDKITKDDVNVLCQKNKIKTIIDLRTDLEVEENNDYKFEGVNYQHMPIFNYIIPGSSHEKESDYNDFDGDLKNMYKQILSGEYLVNVSEIIKKILNLNNDEFPVIIHCTEGKDRTGIIIAILLMILGANKETIIDDYLETNIINKKKANRYYWMTRILKLDRKKAEVIRNALLAKKEYIESVFEVIEEDWNGVDEFIKNGLKLTQSEIDKFKKNIVI